MGEMRRLVIFYSCLLSSILVLCLFFFFLLIIIAFIRFFLHVLSFLFSFRWTCEYCTRNVNVSIDLKRWFDEACVDAQSLGVPRSESQASKAPPLRFRPGHYMNPRQYKVLRAYHHE